MDGYSGVVDLGEVFRVCGENFRPFVCGPEVNKFGIVAIGQTGRTEHNLNVFALVMQCSHTTEKPHEVDIEVRLSKLRNRITKTSCTCLAGKGCCKHIISTCMRLFKMNINVLEPISCTDLRQKWGKSTMSRRSKGMFRGDELSRTCHLKQKVFKDPPIPTTFGYHVRYIFKTCNPSCELSLFKAAKRCTTRKPKKVSTLHKSIVRAIRTLTNSPSCKVIVRTGKSIISDKQAGTLQQPSLNVRQGLMTSTGISSAKVKQNIKPLPNATAPRRIPLGGLQPKATTNPGLMTSTGISSSKVTPNATAPRRIPLGGLLQPKATTNPGKEATTPEQRRQQWADISKRRMPPQPSRVISEAFLHRLLHQKLPVNVSPELFLCPEDEEYFFRNVCVTAEEAQKLFFQSTGQSKSNVWMAARRRRFTGSVCYRLFTPKTPLSDKAFWKLKLKCLLEDKFQGNFNTRRGLEDEPFARRRYEEVHGVAVEELGLLVHPDMPWFGFSADGVIGEEILFETKSPECGICQPAMEIVKNLPYIRTDKNGNVRLAQRHTYYGQVQLGMALTGLKKCHFVVYASFDDSIVVIEVPLDPPFLKSLLSKLTGIYFSHFLQILRESRL